MSALLFIIPAVALALIFAPLFPVYKGRVTGKKAKHRLVFNMASFFGLCLLCVIFPIAGFAAEDTTAVAAVSNDAGLAYIAAALSTGVAAIASGIAVAAAAPAAIGAFSEDPKAFGKALIFVALGEGIAIYGLLISILILNKV